MNVEQLASEYEKQKEISRDDYMAEYAAEDFIAGYNKANEWISVETELPPKGVHVLVLPKRGCIKIDYHRTWNSYGTTINDFTTRNVTHWMELPKTPQQKLASKE